MPAKNSLKSYAPDRYYHVYNRGVAKQKIFLDAEDKKKFLDIFARHLDENREDVRYDGVAYEKYPSLELLAYCLMGNHFHLMFFIGQDETVLKRCLQQVFTAYAMYFNKKYNRVGPVFQGVYKASMIENEAYLLHITRYIHLNPRKYRTYFYSSLKNYLGIRPNPQWLKPQRLMAIFDERRVDYSAFLEDYEDMRDTLQVLKKELADG